MRHPWVNIALLFLLAVQLLTGFFGLISGAPAERWVLWLHGIVAYAILVATVWKGRVIIDALRRRRLTWRTLGFLAMTVLTLLIMLTGLIWTYAGARYYANLSLMTIHALLALALVALLTWHTLVRRFVFGVPRARNRRAFVRLAGVGFAGLVLWQGARSAKAALGLPGAGRRFTGSYETGSLSGAFPTVSWLFDRPSAIGRQEWRLVIDGAVERPSIIEYEQADQMARQKLTAVIDCTGGWYSAQEWRGIELGRLLDLAGLLPVALSVSVASISGYVRRFPIEEARSFVLAMQVAGEPLSHDHGFPARLVAPGHRGYDWVKWVTHIRVNETGPLWQPPLPLQ